SIHEVRPTLLRHSLDPLAHINLYCWLPTSPSAGGDHHNAVCSPGTVDGRRRCIFQYRHRFSILWINRTHGVRLLAGRGRDREAINHIKPIAASTDCPDPPHLNFRSTTGCPIRCTDVNTCHLTG